jgi:hypothetical protein
MPDQAPLTTITTSDRCPACGTGDIAARDGVPPTESVHPFACRRCGFAFYRYRRTDDGKVQGGPRQPPPIGGGAPASPPWYLVTGGPADFPDELLRFGADVLLVAGATRARSQVTRAQARAIRHALAASGGPLPRG